ncbi:hypothetical protein CTAYLR_000197 [Chrysophaeum taylorii]|uniref:L-type lectin-like domain-containing protein n=1 Tax=Chrysophaeum taylorii TaxID=2483200 RepID=A0AAD7UFS5_9STRA|nr:hypothetical protein CTAYLR_000197 [Chrysophaeum taylorii]
MKRRYGSRLVVLALCIGGAGSAQIEALSFSAPFSVLNSQGERQVGKNWRSSGTTTVHANFARLTPDRQSKKGALWSTKAIGTGEASIAFKFRISGQGKKYFGDGMALWLSESRSYRSGDFHGSADKFRGIGIIIDTFKNAELLSYHKDVTVVVNEGESDVEEMLTSSVGCNGDIRYHEDRGDFSVSAASRVKFVVEPVAPDGSGDDRVLGLTVFLDATNSGEYRECVAQTPLPATLDASWLSRAYLGISASTGQLADNHDVLSLDVFSDKEVHNEVESEMISEPNFAPGEGVSPARFERIEAQIDQLIGRLEHLQHHLEHEMVAVDDHVRTTVDKLAKQEQAAETRIEALEDKVTSSVEDSLSQRISNLENAMRDAVQQRMKKVEQTTIAKITDTVGKELKGKGRRWTLGFLFLVAVDVVAAIAVYKWYCTMMLARVGARRFLSEAAVEPPIKLFGIHARYASAAFVAAAKADQLDRVESELLAFKSVLGKDEKLASFVENPTISREMKIDAVDKLLGSRVHMITKNTLETLAANARLAEVEKVIDAYATLMKAQRKEVDAIITSAEPLTPSETSAIKNALKPHLDEGETVVVTTEVKPSLLGGFTVQIGDKFLDLSASSKIAALQRAL